MCSCLSFRTGRSPVIWAVRRWRLGEAVQPVAYELHLRTHPEYSAFPAAHKHTDIHIKIYKNDTQVYCFVQNSD